MSLGSWPDMDEKTCRGAIYSAVYNTDHCSFATTKNLQGYVVVMSWYQGIARADIVDLAHLSAHRNK